jgi:D-alanyl-D-alanine dipeptidase
MLAICAGTDDGQLLLIGDPLVKRIPVRENGDVFVDLLKDYPQLKFDQTRTHVQKVSEKIHFVRQSVAERLVQAQSLLPKNLQFLIKECYRPLEVQRNFWNQYWSKIHSQHSEWSEAEVSAECSKFIAPLEVAPHSTGGAVDLVLTNAQGELCDMGCQFNASPISCNDATFTNAPNIPAKAKSYRRILVSAMSRAGFVNYPTEFWHWSYGDKYWAAVTKSPHAIFSSVESEADL